MPGLKRAEVLVHHEHQRRVGVLQDAVDDDVVAGQDLRERLRRLERERARRVGRIALEVPHPHRRERRGDRGHRALGEHRHVADAERRQPPHRPARGGAEADDRGAQAAAVVPAGAQQLERVQDRAIARQLVVLVEDVQDEVAALAPVVHRLPGDEGQPAVDGQLGHLAVLHAVRPAPDDLARAQRRAGPRPAAWAAGARRTAAKSSSRERSPATSGASCASEDPSRSP